MSTSELKSIIQQLIQHSENAFEVISSEEAEIKSMLDHVAKPKNKPTSDDRAEKYAWISGWSHATNRNAIRSLKSIKDLSNKALDLVPSESSSLSIIRPMDEFDNKLEDAVTGIENAHKERISFMEKGDSTELIVCDLLRGAIRDLSICLSKMGCKREAGNIVSHLEDGVGP